MNSLKRFLREWGRVVLGIGLTLINLDSFIDAVVFDAPLPILVLVFLGFMTGLHMLFTTLTGYPIPYSLDKEHPIGKLTGVKRVVKAITSIVTFPTEIPNMWRYYTIGKHCGVYREDMVKRETHLLNLFTGVQQSIIIGYAFNKVDSFTDGYLTELVFRVNCIRQMEDEREYEKFVQFEEGFKFGVYEVEMTFKNDFDTYHVIRCSECGERNSVRNEVIATKLLTECKHHYIIPRL